MEPPDEGAPHSAVEFSHSHNFQPADGTGGNTESRGLLGRAATSSRPDEPAEVSQKASAAEQPDDGGGIPAGRSCMQHEKQPEQFSRWDIIRAHLNKRVRVMP